MGAINHQTTGGLSLCYQHYMLYHCSMFIQHDRITIKQQIQSKVLVYAGDQEKNNSAVDESCAPKLHQPKQDKVQMVHLGSEPELLESGRSPTIATNAPPGCHRGWCGRTAHIAINKLRVLNNMRKKHGEWMIINVFEKQTLDLW